MLQRSAFFITGVIEKVTAGSAKLTEDVPCTDLYIKVAGNSGRENLFRVTFYHRGENTDETAKLRPGATVFVSGTMTGTRNDKGYFNYYLTGRDVFLAPAGQRGIPRDNEPLPF